MNTWQKTLNQWKNKAFIKQLKKDFPKAEIFLVGGAVRDAILRTPTKDFDLVIRGISKNDLEKFLKKLGRVSLVGKKFGVFKFKPKNWNNDDIDIALPRTEHSLNRSGAYKDFKIKSNAKLKIIDDLSRRDFTINAMAWNINTKELIDPFMGQQDLAKKIIKAVGKPEKRFTEDYSRMLRAIRFACQLNFTIERDTWKSIAKGIKKINKKIDNKPVVPYEIIAKELFKAMYYNPIKAIELLEKSGTIKILMPELLKMKGCPQPKNWHSEGDCWKHTILSLKNLESKEFKKEFGNQPPIPEVIWGLLFHDIGKPYTIIKADRLRFNNHDSVSAEMFRKISERLKLSAAGLNINEVEKIIAKHMLPTHGKNSKMKDVTIEKYFFSPDFPGKKLLMLIFADIMATVPPNGQPDFTEYNSIKKRINNLTKRTRAQKNLPKPIITGYDLMKKFKLKSGPQIGKLLTIAREAQLNGKIKTKAQGLDLIAKNQGISKK